ncbi:bifunctional 2-keto-4-hydroxyglutarate aldolase/2-keto-3-deoxy-6-phosphogluconate aldolase [Vallitalea sp.]|jgi:2-dehydro-3-deoxyphosphogluconate aldolase/(4S)-4-hydroxy-2-oxoglutarate aldolase|uniref:bifunctional 2-keto-4-hydroxyglutarate aldolase/2-keto-3-deoxy-6-phosphogluconate aldolase n=1 Tax=Vallitalea sp. TaxID=1882829 RepID=UPI0025FBD3A7|nr:bifunctional 2-keto-4-hydroxyglutarate aldolase/2-keto-3-deoxy-6-phosphogluconate aldolase [Vallitalea sp.]MCT4687345.1 bifunctional 2-keto-4-hydroxyglutarate aldolase/2-keto-3-deoxy-6-phosphogluconate aldolase [Vallitalea sp.]
MDKETVIKRISEVGLVAVVRAESAEKAKKITEACIKGGVAAIEITFTVPQAHEIIAKLSKTYSEDDIILGAGTVLDSETARLAILSGAQYIVSSSYSEETAKLCNRYRVPYMPGCMTMKEIVEAMEGGADIIKVFPGDMLGTKFIKAVKGPMPQVKMMPTGGVDVDNVKDWVNAGVVACGAGSSLTAGAKTGDYDKVVETAKLFIERINEARKNVR